MKKYCYIFNKGSKINQIICAVLINLPVFVYGASIAWMSPMTLLLQSANSPKGEPLTDYEISWMASAAYLVCIPMDYIMAIVGDKIGRKLTLIFMSVTCAALWVIKLSSLETWALILARGLLGITMAGCFVTCPTYTKEISDDSVRGVLGTLVVVFQTIGNLFMFIIGDVLSYHTISWVCLALPTAHILLFMMMPESPSYLIKKGKHQEAARVMAWLQCTTEDDSCVQKALDVLKKEQSNDEKSKENVYKNLFKNKILFRAFKIAMAVTFARELCGVNVALNFAGDIFSTSSEGSGLVLTPNQQAMLLGAVQVAGSLLAAAIVEKAGRKPLLFVSSLLSGISMCTLASWFLARAHSLHGVSWLPIFTLCLCIFCDSAGLAPVSVVVVGEIFSFKYRASVLAISMASASVTDFIQLLSFKPISNSIGVHFVFYFFGLVCLVNAIYVIIALPETKKRSLEEIYEELKSKKEKEAEAIDSAIDRKELAYVN